MAVLLSPFSPELLSPFSLELGYLLLPHLLLSSFSSEVKPEPATPRLTAVEKAMARRERRGATGAAMGHGGGGGASPKLRVGGGGVRARARRSCHGGV
jgi:hypothetical protein